MKNLFLVILSLLTVGSLFAQKGGKEKKYDKVVYQEKTLEYDDMTIYIVDGVATDGYIKFKIRIKNKTADYLMLKGSEVSIEVNGEKYSNPDEKDLTIAPNDIESKVIDIKGSNFRNKEFSLVLNGVYKIPIDGKKYDDGIFKLPVSQNSVDMGPFKLTQLKNEKKTDVTLVQFEVSYNGNEAGIVLANNTVLKMPNDAEFANMKRVRKDIVLTKGQTEKFMVGWENIHVSNGDMQFVDMQLLFKNVFIESPLRKMVPVTVPMQFDEAKSK